MTEELSTMSTEDTTSDKQTFVDALGWLKTFVVATGVGLLLLFTVLAVTTIWILVSIHTQNAHSAHTLVTHNAYLTHTLTNTCTLLVKAGAHIPKWCLP